MSDLNPTHIQSAEDFDKDAAGKQKLWAVEIAAAKRSVEKFHKRGRDIIKRFKDERSNEAPYNATGSGDATRLNLFTSNIQVQRAMMYGKTPRCEVSRRYGDPNDTLARVSAQMLTRLLNLDIETDSDDYATALALALDDYQLAGLGVARVRYDASFKTQDAIPAKTAPCACSAMEGQEPMPDCPDCQGAGQTELAPAVPEQEVKDEEYVRVDYIHWKDFLWSPCRVWHEKRWIGYGADMSRDDFKARFGEDKLANVQSVREEARQDSGIKDDPWERIRVWEIWNKEDKTVYWYTDGAKDILDSKPDPYELDEFFPTPRPLAANTTSDTFMPVPDFVLAQDIYDEIDYVSTRITYLERACKVVGVYDSTSEGVKGMLDATTDNELIPVDGWAMWAEKGGVKGQIDWLPLDQIVGALDKLRDYRGELVKLLYEITGMSDIMRGSSNAQETATAQAIKAKFASTRMQAKQDEFARFATELLRLKADLILAHCEDQFILDGSNVMNTPDAPMAQQALQLLRSQAVKFRVEVKPENLSITDYQEMQTERTQVLQGITGFLQAATPMLQGNPSAAPALLELLKWTLAGFRGSSSIEAIIDQEIAAVKQQLAQPPPPPQQDPKIQAQQQKAQLDVGVAKEKAKIETDKLHQKNQIDQQKLQVDAARAKMEIQKQMEQMRMDAIKGMMPDPAAGAMAPEKPRPQR